PGNRAEEHPQGRQEGQEGAAGPQEGRRPDTAEGAQPARRADARHAGRVPRPVADAARARRTATGAGRHRSVEVEVPRQEVKALHLRGRGLPHEQPVEWWIVDGRLSAEPVAGAETIFGRHGYDGWILPGLVDAHCHVGIGPGGAVEFDEAIAQAETERDVGALLLRDCGSPVDTRSLDERDDLPRIIRAGRHLARPKRYLPGLPIDIEDESQLPEYVAQRARWGDGWVKLVGEWIDGSIGDLAPLWSDGVLKEAVDAAHAHGGRVTA